MTTGGWLAGVLAVAFVEAAGQAGGLPVGELRALEGLVFSLAWVVVVWRKRG